MLSVVLSPQRLCGWVRVLSGRENGRRYTYTHEPSFTLPWVGRMALDLIHYKRRERETKGLPLEAPLEKCFPYGTQAKEVRGLFSLSQHTPRRLVLAEWEKGFEGEIFVGCFDTKDIQLQFISTTLEIQRPHGVL